ncbi:MAG: 2-oxoacid:acceptor oxidoreductase subunit alpha [Chromatiales bacterium]|jgi:2-oxoglutarate/2-oxoacid ferredoxin oxidoreductase subunit alpha|nr:2-oxoacid:acceptor oxidoreductase subunit alpha [Chromatiales bacterium]
MAQPSGGVNDFVIKLANVNGTGSASANGWLMRSLFRMGVPVTGKNYFPSNIQGLPTWYEIRVSGDGYLGSAGRVDVMVAMNAESYAVDLADVAPGGVFIYDSSWPRDRQLARDEVQLIGIPLANLCNDLFEVPRTRILMKNMAYFGALLPLLNIDIDIVEALVEERLGNKKGLMQANMDAIHVGRDFAVENFNCPLPMHIQKMDKTDGYVLMDGNTAAGLGAVYAGATVGAWYPITPSTSLMDAFGGFCERFRVDRETGEKRFCIIQAEDELGAIGMVVGAGWSGARAFTSTSGPGISLMSELLGYASFTEVPVVLFDVQRVGPSTGLPTRTQQSDVLACAYASHGDTRHAVLFPANPAECFEMAISAFDAAERLQTPVIVLSDLDIGMNDWMTKELTWDESYTPDRGKVMDAEALEAAESFRRYADTDGDGIPHRSLPGVHPKGGYFTRGSGHSEAATYTEDSGEYERLMDRLKRKMDGASAILPQPILRKAPKPTRIGILAYGSSDDAVLEALDKMSRAGVHADYLRVKAFPFAHTVQAFLDAHDQIFVVEQNRDAQLKTLMLSELEITKSKLTSVLRYDGMPLTAKVVMDGMTLALGREAAA